MGLIFLNYTPQVGIPHALQPALASIAPAPALVPVGNPQPAVAILLPTCGFVGEHFDLLIQASLLAGFAFGEEKPSWRFHPKEGLLDLGLRSWDHPLLLLPPSEDGFSPFSHFRALGFCRGDGGRPGAAAVREAGGAETRVMCLLPLGLVLWGWGW